MSEQPTGIAAFATHSGKLTLGDDEVPAHVLLGGLRVVEVTSIETLIGLPESGLGAFLASLPGTDRVWFFRAGKGKTWGLPATKVPELLAAYWQANPATEAGEKAGKILHALLVKGLQVAGHDPVNADILMAAAAPRRKK